MTITLPGTAPEYRIEIPEENAKVLLHSCCAPCSSAILECMLKNGITPVVFFSNSNIYPEGEYITRRDELMRYCGMLGVEYVVDEYDHSNWLECVAKGREDAPERGCRCAQCFKYRLGRAAEYARANGFTHLTTTLASSRWKLLEQVDEAGEAACADAGISWWAMNWRKGGLQPRRNELTKELGFYNQLFCGCEFSNKEFSNKG